MEKITEKEFISRCNIKNKLGETVSGFDAYNLFCMMVFSDMEKTDEYKNNKPHCFMAGVYTIYQEGRERNLWVDSSCHKSPLRGGCDFGITNMIIFDEITDDILDKINYYKKNGTTKFL